LVCLSSVQYCLNSTSNQTLLIDIPLSPTFLQNSSTWLATLPQLDLIHGKKYASTIGNPASLALLTLSAHAGSKSPTDLQHLITAICEYPFCLIHLNVSTSVAWETSTPSPPWSLSLNVSGITLGCDGVFGCVDGLDPPLD